MPDQPEIPDDELDEDGNPLSEEQKEERRRAREQESATGRKGFGFRAGKAARDAMAMAKETASTARKEKDKTLIVMVVIIAVVLIAFVGVALLVRSTAPQPMATVVNPDFNVDMSSQAELRGFTKKTAQEVNGLVEAVKEMKTLVDGVAKRQEELEKQRLGDKDQMREVLTKAIADLKSVADQKFELAADAARRGGGPKQTAPTQVDGILEDFRKNLMSLKETPAEARAHAAKLLHDAGYSDEKIRDLLADAATQAGRITVGDVAEKPLSDAERESAPTWVRPHLNAIRDLMYGMALTTGRFYPEQLKAEVRDYLKAHVPARGTDVSEDLVTQTAYLARVRRENLTPALEDVLPFLVTMRDEQHLERSNTAGIATLVWNARERYSQDVTPGQMLTLCHVVARSVGGSSRTDTNFQPLDGNGENYATSVVTTAAANAIQLGKDQSEQYQTCERALTNYLDTARYTATPDQKKAIILRSMTSASARLKRPPAPPEPKAAKTAKPADDESLDDRFLYFGPLKVERGRAMRALVFATPGLARSNGLEVAKAGGAAAVVTAWEQSPRLVSTHLGPNAGKPMGGYAFMSATIPELLLVMREADNLGRIPLAVTADPTLKASPANDLVRGVVIGSIYGPFIQDEEKAKAAAAQILPELQAKQPLTQDLAQHLAGVPAGRPFQSLIAAYEAFRPGRFGYPGDRFQAMSDLIDRSAALTTAMRDVLAEEIPSEQLGAYIENLRLFIPLAVASHDDSTNDIAAIQDAVKDDVWQYTALYLSEYLIGHQTTEQLIPRYASTISGNDAGAAIIQRVTEFVPAKIAELYRHRAAAVRAETIVQVAHQVADEASPLVEAFIVREAVMSRVTPRLELIVRDRASLASVIDAVRQRASEVIQMPYTPARIDGWATQLTDEGRRMVDGTGGQPASTERDVQGNPGGKRTGMWPALGMIAGVPGGQLVGTTTSMVRTRKIVIPAASFANAHMLTGVDAEIGGGRSNLPIVVNVDLAWNGPASSRLLMRNCRLSGTANAMAGPERVAVDLKKLSFVFPSGREINTEVNGFVADNISGRFGGLGTYEWNFDKVLPLAVLSGGAQGVGDALKASTQTQVVGITGASTSVNTGSTFKQAAAGGISGGFGIMSDHIKGVLNDIRPSVDMPNGQRVSVVLLEPVTFDVPESEFSYITEGGGGGFAK